MLPRAARLLNRRDFRAAYSRSQSFATPRLVLYRRPRRGPADAEAGALLVGYSISKKTCRKAHDRTRLKRRLREITRLDVLPAVRPGSRIDAVVVARTAAPEATYAALRDDLVQAAFHRGLLLLGCGESAIRFCPPLCITAEQVERALEILSGVLAERLSAVSV